MVNIVTARLTLRPITIDDVDRVHALWTDGDVRRYLWDDTIIPRQRAEEAVLAVVSAFERNGRGMWLVYETGRRTPCGFCGFLPAGELDRVELTYGLVRRVWGRGYAQESARAVIAHAFERLNVAKIVASADAPNAASVRVMERLGMRFDRGEVVNGIALVFYEMDNPARGANVPTGSSDTARR